jgi:hypothetical protein
MGAGSNEFIMWGVAGVLRGEMGEFSNRRVIRNYWKGALCANLRPHSHRRSIT